MVTGRRRNREVVVQTVLFIAVCTVALTASFVGVVAILTGEVSGLTNRLPFYVLAMAMAFVGSLLTFEGEFDSGRNVIETAVLAGVVTFLIVTLAGEGVAYTLQHPDRVITSQLLFYFIAAGLMGTGLGYWGLNHWQEFTRDRSGL